MALFAINHQIGRGCIGNSCATASGAYSGVYNSHATPRQGMEMGNLPFGFNVLQPGLNQPMPQARPAVMGVAPIGNYMIAQSVPSQDNTFAEVASRPAPYQAVAVPTVMERGRPQVGANASVVDMGLFWQICENKNMGLFQQNVCRTEPKFR